VFSLLWKKGGRPAEGGEGRRNPEAGPPRPHRKKGKKCRRLGFSVSGKKKGAVGEKKGGKSTPQQEKKKEKPTEDVTTPAFQERKKGKGAIQRGEGRSFFPPL